jgi:excisionase family DNA binding protein
VILAALLFMLLMTGGEGPSSVLTVEEAAAMLRIGRTAAYDAARRGDLPTIRIGRRIRVPRRALEKMLDTAARQGD